MLTPSFASGAPMVPKSVLNDLRRQAVASLSAKRAARQNTAIVDSDAVDARLAELARHEAAVIADATPRPRLHA